MTAWSKVAQEFRDEAVLKSVGVGARFIAVFTRGRLVLRLAHGVDRLVDASEFRAAWRLLDNGATIDELRLVTPSGAYLAAVRDELLRRGVDLNIDDDDDGDGQLLVESALVTQAAALTQVAPQEGEQRGSQSGESVSVDVVSKITAERDGLARANARLQARVADLESRSALEEKRTAELLAELEEMRRSLASPSIGQTPTDLASVVAWMKAHLDLARRQRSRAGLELAADVIDEHPDHAIMECRKVLEAEAHTLWASVFKSDEHQPDTPFTDVMYDLRDQPDVGRRRWNLHKTLYTVASASAHDNRPATPSTAVLVWLGTLDIAAYP